MGSSDGSGERRVQLDVVIGEFQRFLAVVKGVSAATSQCYVHHLRPFLAEMVDTATAIRAFLGFAWLSGWTRCDLTIAVGPVLTHRSGRLPKALPAEAVRRLLAVPDRATTMGTRDYALLMVLARLGLRAGEVAGLRLDDFDCHAATVTPRVKGGRTLCLPIPHDVGQEVVAYLGRRPVGVACREVFLHVRGGPVPMTARAVSQVVARYADRAGLGTVRAHRPRHSAARAVLSAGGSPTEVGELLGHSDGAVTMMYASLRPAVVGRSCTSGWWRPSMCELLALISEYMAFRPNRKAAHLLTQFVGSLPAERDDGLRSPRLTRWRGRTPPSMDAGMADSSVVHVRQFAIYLAGCGLPVGVPAARQGVSGSRRAIPYLYSADDIRALMEAADQLFTALRAATMKTLIGLLAVTGMRIGEAVRLTVGDVDLDHGVVLIAVAKFGRQRTVRLDRSSCDALAGYLSFPVRHRLGAGPDHAVFVMSQALPSMSTPPKARSTGWSATLVCRFVRAPVRGCTIMPTSSLCRRRL